MILTKKRKKEIAKDIAFIAAALTDVEMDSRLFAKCQDRLTEIADKIGGINMVADVSAIVHTLQMEIKAIRLFEENTCTNLRR